MRTVTKNENERLFEEVLAQREKIREELKRKARNYCSLKEEEVKEKPNRKIVCLLEVEPDSEV
ncbi:hypothetical protein [Desulfovibrio sp. JC022]|uniref:hypothetical protein n=1 Tax=Desulfovibrio sp. JC022 TaxID=2593642 RepID=UPI0013D447E6|nr:hypothetical protein [Desulfovibrio sp. JC022]NDV21577.1 hypothetical protein [Desulfovibrio sp. JC022]